MKRILLMFALGTVLFSCQSDTVGVSDVDIVANPLIAVPIGEINLTMDHLLTPDDSLIFDDNTTYKLVVAQDSVFGISVNDLISLPAQSPSNSSITMGTIGVNSVAMTNSISLGSVASSANLTGISSAHNTTAPFPEIDQTNLGPYGGGGFGTFTTATFSSGSLDLTLTNNWPVSVTMNVDLVDKTTNNTTILSYSLPNVPSGNSVSAPGDLTGKTLPNNIGFIITSLNSSDSSSVYIDTTDALELQISSQDLEVYSAVTQIATQDISSDTQYVDLSTGGSEELRELRFQTASFDFEFTSSLAEDMELTIGFPGSDKNGIEVDTVITIASGATTTGSINLNNTILDLTTDPSQAHSKLPVAVFAKLIGSGNLVTVDSSDALAMQFEMTNLQFGHIKGFFGTQQIVIDPGNVPLSVDFLENFEGSISFSEPSISMDITNSIGLPIELALDFTSFGDGTSFPLNGPDYMLPAPSVLGSTETGTLVYDNTNSQIVDVFTLPKDSISYGGAVNINHDTATFGTENFVTNTSAISGNLFMELPFAITASGLTFGDTLAQDLNLSESIPDSMIVEEVKLFMTNTTSLPLNATVELKFYDENWVLVHNELISLLESGVPNSNGVVTAANSLATEISLEGAALDAVLASRSVIAEAVMETFDSGNSPVKLRTDARISIELGIGIKVGANIEIL
jgi:hypothetical protein